MGNERHFKREMQRASDGGDAFPTTPWQPVPTLVTTAQVTHGGQPLVLLHVSTPSGVGVYFLDAEAAKRIGEELVKTARMASSGLVLASGAQN